MQPARPTPPGNVIRREIAARCWTQAQLAEQMGRPVQTISLICTGKKAITPATALQLEDVLGEPGAQFWLDLESRWRLWLEREKRRLSE